MASQHPNDEQDFRHMDPQDASPYLGHHGQSRPQIPMSHSFNNRQLGLRSDASSPYHWQSIQTPNQGVVGPHALDNSHPSGQASQRQTKSHVTNLARPLYESDPPMFPPQSLHNQPAPNFKHESSPSLNIRSNMSTLPLQSTLSPHNGTVWQNIVKYDERQEVPNPQSSMLHGCDLELERPLTIPPSVRQDHHTPSPHENLFNLLTEKYLYQSNFVDTGKIAAIIMAPLTDRYEDATMVYSADLPAPTVKGHLTLVYGLILDLVDQVPTTHIYLNKFVDLLRAIQHLPHPDTRLRPDIDYMLFEKQWGGKLWWDLPIFGSTVLEDFQSRGAWEKATAAHKEWYQRPLTSEAFARRNALLAKLTTANVLNFIDFSIWIFSRSLEGRPNIGDLDESLPSAALWVVHAGSYVFHNSVPGGSDPESADKGALYSGAGGFSLDRWSFWKSQFMAYASAEYLVQTTRNYAKQAFERMQEIELQDGMPTPILSTIGMGWPVAVCQTTPKKVDRLDDRQRAQHAQLHGRRSTA